MEHGPVLGFSWEGRVRDLVPHVFIPEVVATRANCRLCCAFGEWVLSLGFAHTELNVTLFYFDKVIKHTFGDFFKYSSDTL